MNRNSGKRAVRPIVTSRDQKAILSYEVANISNLSEAVQQVIHVLREAAKKTKFFEAKRATRIIIEQKKGATPSLHMHFIIPIQLRDSRMVEKILNGTTQSNAMVLAREAGEGANAPQNVV